MQHVSPIIVAAVATAASLSAAPAVAQDASQRILDTFGACRSVQGTDARLACFEQAYDGFAAQVKTKAVRVIDKKEIATTKRSLFGFSLPKIALFGGGTDGGKTNDDEPEFTQIDSTVASVRPIASGRIEFSLAEQGGAVWHSTDPVPFPPKVGDKIHIKRGALGNYFISSGGSRFRGSRMR